jgi:hypothetical protein
MPELATLDAVGQHRAPRVDRFVQGSRRPLAPGTSLGRDSATVTEVSQQAVQIWPGELLRRQRAVAFAQRRHGVDQGVDRGRAGVMKRREPVRAQFVDGDSFARHERVVRSVVGDRAEFFARVALRLEASANLSATTGQ